MPKQRPPTTRGNLALQAQWQEQTDTQRIALFLHKLGLTVMYLPISSKEPVIQFNGRSIQMKWNGFYYQRMSEGGLYHAVKGRCNIAVIAREGFFFIDCETAAAFEWVKAEFRKRGIPVFAVHSGGAKGGGHIYLRCAAGEIENIPLANPKKGKTAGHMAHIEIRAYHVYVVGPGSVHPTTGAFYKLDKDNPDQIPVVELPQLDGIFIDMEGQPITLKLKQQPKAKPVYADSRMNDAIHVYLTSGHLLPEGVRNETLNRIAWQMHQNGFSDSEIEVSAGQVAIRGGQTSQAVRDTLKSVCNAPLLAKPDYDTKHSARYQYCASIRQFSHMHTWKGQTGSTDRNVFEALIHRCELGGYPAKGSKTVHSTGAGVADAPRAFSSSYVFRGTIREIAELSHASNRTVTVSLQRLVEAALIAQVGKDDSAALPRKARLWKFSGEAVNFPQCNHWLLPILEDCSGYIAGSSDVLERGAIGANGMRVYKTLVASAEPMSVGEIAQQVNLTPKQIHYVLSPDKPLRANSLIVRVGKNTYTALAATDEKFQEIAVKYDKGGRSQKRKERNADDRAAQLERMVINWREKYDNVNYILLDEPAKPRKSAKPAVIIPLGNDSPQPRESVANEEILQDDPLMTLGRELGAVIVEVKPK